MAGPATQGNLSIPPTPDSITPEWLTAALRGFGAIENTKVVSIGVKPVAAGRGFVGQAARLHIEYDRTEPGAPATVFAKLLSADPAVRKKLRTLAFTKPKPGSTGTWLRQGRYPCVCLDFSSERRAGLARRASERLGTMLEDHQFAEHLEDLA